MITLRNLTLASILLFISSCSAELSDYEKTSPKLDIKTFFSGDFIAWGMVQDYTSQVTRRFCVELNGTWQNNQGKLKEAFYFNDGEISYRTWMLTKLSDDQYTGTAEDVVGIAEGGRMGYAFRWEYQLLVPIDDETYAFEMDDWMYQLDENRIMNKTTMSKLGVELAEITLFFDKTSTKKTCQ
jgi:hypothetical protein